LKSCCVLQEHYDHEIDKIVFHDTKQNCKIETKTDFWARTSLVLRPTVSDHITVIRLAAHAHKGKATSLADVSSTLVCLLIGLR